MKQTIALAGNPNAGKTSLFNVLTGTRQHVGNWPGVTVDKKEGQIRKLSNSLLIDLPGIYSLSARSLEEKLATWYLLKETPNTLLNIVDASNLERNLYFSVQLLEMGLPTIMALNMIDVATSRGLHIDHKKLEQLLGIPVVPMVARKGKGQEQLLKQLENKAERSTLIIRYADPIEEAIHELSVLFDAAPLHVAPCTRWLAIMWLERNETFERFIGELLEPGLLKRLEAVRDQCGKECGIEIRNVRYAWISRLLEQVTVQKQTMGRNWSDRIDNLVLNRYLGIPLFLAFMFLVFQITFSWVGTSLSDQIDAFLSGPLSAGLQNVLDQLASPEWFSRLMIDGILAGVGAVLVFVPQIGILFLCLSFLEDSGYMARVAILMDRLMRAIGLNGKAFIPLILGFGCNVPAIMATRALDDPKGRLITSLISPFMSCSARLSVYSLFVAAFFAKGQAIIVLILYITGIVMAVLTAFLLRKFVPAEEEGLFLMELPPYRAPMIKSLLLHTWDKAKGFVRKAGTIIFGMSVLLWFLGHYSIHGAVEMNESFLAAIGGFIAPLFAPLGFSTWQAGVSLITGFMAKEVVVATMGIVYEASEASLGTLLQGAFSPAAALSFLFFILLYTPCVSTVVVMKKETGSWKWTLLSILYSFVVAWLAAFIVYRIALWIF